eukprot:g4840.t1
MILANVLVMLGTFVIGLPALITFYLWRHKHELHSIQVKERIGFLYERYNRGAEGWEVHEVVRKALLTGAIVFIDDPLLQTTGAVIVCAGACCHLNYFRPYKKKLLFWLGQLSFFITLLVFLFTVVLIGSQVRSLEKETVGKETTFVVGVALIAINLIVIIITFVSMTVDIVNIVRHLRQLDKDARMSKLQIQPLGDEEKKSLRKYGQRIIESKQPVAIKNMQQFTRVVFSANSEQYRTMLSILKDVKKDRIRDKRELLRRIQEVFQHADDASRLKAIELTNDLWLV